MIIIGGSDAVQDVLIERLKRRARFQKRALEHRKKIRAKWREEPMYKIKFITGPMLPEKPQKWWQTSAP